MQQRFITIALAWLVSTILVSAQTFQVLYSFSDLGRVYPDGKLLLNGDTLYGVTMVGGSFGHGSVFKIKTNGSNYQVIKSFSTTATPTEGTVPLAGLVMLSNKLYGTTSSGGTSNLGTAFSLNTDGTGFAVLNHFTGKNGKNPYCGLTVGGNVLYGTTAAGGISNKGAIFRINGDGSEFSLIKSFTLSDGLLLLSPLTLSVDGATLYGTTYDGGLSNRGTVYRIGTNGSDFTTIKNFSDNEGQQPRNGLVLISNTLYGTTEGDFTGTNGVVFRVNTDGTGDAVVKRFSIPDPETGNNNDGSYPHDGGLAYWNGVLYGATQNGGTNGTGVIYKVNPDGSGFAVLKHFGVGTNSSSVEPLFPAAELMAADGVLYGTTEYGGLHGSGAIFKMTIPPTPTLQVTNVAGAPLICWSDDGLNRTLQTTTDLATGSWNSMTSLNWTNASSNPPQVGYRINVSTNTAAAFFRLL